MSQEEWRYLAQNVVTGEMISTDLPLRDVELIDELSGPGGIMASIAPELRSATVRGKRILQEWQTAIYAEDRSGNIRGAGLLVHSEASDETQRWDLECPGFTSYANGMPYEGWLSWWDADPFEVVREIWSHLQSFPQGNLGLLVSSAASSARLGPPQPPPRPADYVKGELKAPLKGDKPNKGKQPKRKPKESDSSYNTRLVAWDQAYNLKITLWEHDYDLRRQAYEQAKATQEEGEDYRKALQEQWDLDYGAFKPYELLWWEATDCGSEIDTLATQVPFEYRERHAWNADKSDVEHFLDLAAPTIGSRRHDLRFVVGENVVVVPPPEFDGDEFANHVIGLGKGDGQAMLRVQLNTPDARLRRTRVLPAKDVGDENRLRALTDSELRYASVLGSIMQLVVIDHRNAPLGSFASGDEVFVHAGGDGWFGIDMWVRIVSISVRPEDDSRMTLTVVASERV